jgi:membrane-associated phospholipid phosphatase
MSAQPDAAIRVALPATPSEQPAHREIGSRGLNGVMTTILVGYLLVVVAIMVIRQVTPTPDIFLIFASIVAVMLGRGRAFLRDWVPFVVIFLAWEAMRGIADDFGAQVHSDGVIAMERLISFGTVPTVELQRLLHVPGTASALDLGMSIVYLGHFLWPLLIAFGLWVRSRPRYYEFVVALMLMSFAAFFTALFLPVAPPRFAFQYGEALPVKDVLWDTLRQLHFSPITTWAYGNLVGNPVAAFPSLHAAYPFLGFLVLRGRYPRLSLAMLAWCLVVWFAIVYLGHHYVVDIVGGVAYAIAALWVVRSRWAHDLARYVMGRASRVRRGTPAPSQGSAAGS